MPASRLTHGTPRAPVLTKVPAAPLPAWPIYLVFVGYPMWWALGCVDFMWPPAAAVMVLYLRRRSAVRIPRGFGLWLVFLVWLCLSVIGLDSVGRLIGFAYRLLQYLAATIFFIYVYNAWSTVDERKVIGALTSYWVTTVVGGYLGIFFPTTVVRTPLSYVMPQSLLSNELVNAMVIRRFAQFNPEAYFFIDPRPSAPFLYTNNWGNVFSMLLPVVLVYLLQVRGQRRFWFLALAVPLSLVPAFLTLNRGMFLGLGLAAGYALVRLVMARNTKGILSVAAVAVIGALAFSLLPAQERLDNRLESSSTTEDRASLYGQVLESVRENPVFGVGAPRPSTDGSPSIGTQGQFWLVLYSHGIGGLLGFVGWFLVAVVGSLRRRDPVGMAANCVLVVATVELLYYGFVPNGLPVVMTMAGLALRGPDPLRAPDLEPSAAETAQRRPQERPA